MHHYTLLDGEMVVDTDGKVGTQRRRYLAYDCLALNSQAVVQRSFAVRSRAGPPCTPLLSTPFNVW